MDNERLSHLIGRTIKAAFRGRGYAYGNSTIIVFTDGTGLAVGPHGGLDYLGVDMCKRLTESVRGQAEAIRRALGERHG